MPPARSRFGTVHAVDSKAVATASDNGGMLDPGLTVLAKIGGDAADAALREARVLLGSDTSAELVFVADHPLLDGAPLEVHFYRGSRFVRRPARVVDIDGRRVAVEWLAVPSPAETRGSYRVAVPRGELAAVFDGGDVKESLCDLSAEGFSIRTRHEFALDLVHRVQIRGTGRPIDGDVEVRSVRALAHEALRVGFAVRDPAGRLGVELGTISAELQRRVLVLRRG